MDRLRAFEVFVTVVSRSGFARAADALGTSPANVTRYVNELEAHLGTRLLNRTSRTLSLTEGGETLYARCKSILDDVADTEGLVSSASVEPRGRLAMLEQRRDAFYSKHLDDYYDSGSGRQPSGQPDGASGGYAPGKARALGERDAGDGRVRGDGRLHEFDRSAGVGSRVDPRLDARFPRGPGSGSLGGLPPDSRRDIPGGSRGTIPEHRQHGALPDSEGTPSPAFNGMRGMSGSLWTASPHDVQCWCRIMHFTSWSTNAPYQRIACDGIAIASDQA
ncbi:LysR family transcriptional regulator [Burkholderia sp. PAMC 26561]|uniref:LysR family transcriptional regulator n=1 Tax=Burkholderia sp. PAMC 26561 TaxID=1795043 RepID=UPI00076B0BCA|nr:LysR family transcriptional regulator [Burkholderia sp. PAMC 26561]AME28166.1 hypothetical protein AXG89_30425 [Burkholderia sp. PAMC 26561]